MRKWIAGITCLLVLAGANYEILASEQVLRNGRQFYLELAPVDPRSLMQGDYMALNYAAANVVRDDGGELKHGWIVLTIDARGVAGQPRAVAEVGQLAPEEVRLRFERDGWRVRIGTDAYFFEEGQGRRYEPARYGLFRTDGAGKALLTGLVDKDFKPL